MDQTSYQILYTESVWLLIFFHLLMPEKVTFAWASRISQESQGWWGCCQGCHVIDRPFLQLGYIQTPSVIVLGTRVGACELLTVSFLYSWMDWAHDGSHFHWGSSVSGNLVLSSKKKKHSESSVDPGSVWVPWPRTWRPQTEMKHKIYNTLSPQRQWRPW